MKKTVLALIAVGILSCAAAYAQQDRLAKLDNEMKVIEDVVQVIISDAAYDGYFSSGRVTGTFVEGYGAVVLASVSTRNFRGEKSVKAEAGYEEIRSRLSRIFPDYISRIKELNPNDNIAIIVSPTDKSTTKWTGKRSSKFADAEFKPYSYILSAKRSDILRDPVKFRKIGGETLYAGREDIRIMKAIFSRAIENDFNTHLSSSAIQAAYLEDYGLLFTIEASGNYFSSGPKVTVVADATMITSHSSEGSKKLQIAIDRPDRFFSKAERLAAMEDRFDTLEQRAEMLVDRIAELLGMYSGTIKGLNRDDLVTVCFTASDTRRDALEGLNLRITASVNDIEKHTRGGMDFETLKKNLKISQIK